MRSKLSRLPTLRGYIASPVGSDLGASALGFQHACSRGQRWLSYHLGTPMLGCEMDNSACHYELEELNGPKPGKNVAPFQGRTSVLPPKPYHRGREPRGSLVAEIGAKHVPSTRQLFARLLSRGEAGRSAGDCWICAISISPWSRDFTTIALLLGRTYLQTLPRNIGMKRYKSR